MGYNLDFRVFGPYVDAFFYGVIVTVELSLLSAVIGTLAGFLAGALIWFSPGKPFWLAVNDIFRAIPVIVFMFLAYYFPYERIFGFKPFSSFVCATLALSLSQAAFVADLVFTAANRVNIKTVRGAQSLGIKPQAIFATLILPDIFRQILPALIAFWIGLIKWSSIASVIGCQDVVYVSTVAAGQTYRSFEAWMLVAVVYTILVIPLTLSTRKVEELPWLQRR